MKTIRLVLLFVISLLCTAKITAQNVKIYRNDGTTIKFQHSELDSIVSVAGEAVNKIYKSDGTTVMIPYSEIGCIVALDKEVAETNFIDLGLSVKWAVRNIGAENPEDYGDYFAWGETSVKSSYNKENSLTNGKMMYGISGNDHYDAARANWGYPCRMPTLEEYNELREKCTWKWTTRNGVGGQLVTGPNGKSIFLPAAGVLSGTEFDSQGNNGCYWSASPYEEDNVNAYNNIFNSNGYWGSMRSRGDGLTIRPVSGNIQCIPYTGDTIKVGEFTADISALFTYVPKGGITGGIEYSSSISPKQKQEIEVKSDGEYVITLNGLERGAKYKYRSFVKVNGKYIYGKSEYFITKNNEDNLTKGEWIDLGLSVKWASHNVGAEKPEDSGSYFAWGEIYPKLSYDKDNSVTNGKHMGDISGDSEYDAATANWGGSARMPTSYEIQELCEKCTWEWIPRNGVNGMLITGPNGNSIFLPSAGFRVGPALDGDEMNGFYWSSTPNDTYDDRAYGLSFTKNGFRGSWNYRDNGRSVRAVSN